MFFQIVKGILNLFGFEIKKVSKDPVIDLQCSICEDTVHDFEGLVYRFQNGQEYFICKNCIESEEAIENIEVKNGE